MAFGKDPSQLDEIGTFRQLSKAHQASRPKGGTGAGKPTWIDSFKPATDDPDVIRILNGNYPVEVGLQDGTIAKKVYSYFPYTEHYHAGLKKSCTCSAGPLSAFRDKRQPCIGCDLFWEGRANGKKNGPMSRREMYAFTVLHYAQYAKVEQIDRSTGAVRTNNEGVPYTEWARVFPHERDKFVGREMRDAHLMHWSLGFGHWNTLTEFDKEIGRSCKSCGSRDSVKMEAWICRNPACGEALIDGNTTRFSPKQIDEYTNDRVICAVCKHEGFLKEIVSCTGCGNGQRAEIFDVDLSVKRIIDPNGGNANTLVITTWSNPRPIDGRFKEMAKPLDLAKTFAPTPVEQQAERFGRASTRQPVTAGQHSRPYGASGAPILGTPPAGDPGPGKTSPPYGG